MGRGVVWWCDCEVDLDSSRVVRAEISWRALAKFAWDKRSCSSYLFILESSSV